jgi:hypothetical protein
MTRNDKTHTSTSYVGTFDNTSQGLYEYKRIASRLREKVKGGDFVKRFRAGIRCSQGMTQAKGAKKFDLYFYSGRPFSKENDKRINDIIQSIIKSLS